MKAINSILEVLDIETLKTFILILIGIFVATRLYRLCKKQYQFYKLPQSEKCKLGRHEYKVDDSSIENDVHDAYYVRTYTENCVCGESRKDSFHVFYHQPFETF